MSAARDFTDVAGGDRFTIGETHVITSWLNHPQGCLGYRIETPVGTIVYATDNEPGNPEFDRNLAAGRRRGYLHQRRAVHAGATGEAQRMGPFQLARRRARGGSRGRAESGAVSSRPRLLR